MARSKSIDHYPTSFFRLAEACGQHMETKVVECRTQAEARSLAGRFYAFVGSLKAAVAKYPALAQQTEIERYRSQLLPFAHKVEVTLDPQKPNHLIFRHRSDSWYSQAIERALAGGGPAALASPPPAPAEGERLPKADLKQSAQQEAVAAGFDEAASLSKLLAKGGARADYADIVKAVSEPAESAQEPNQPPIRKL